MKGLRYVYTATFLFSLHLALLSYVNSSMLGEFASPKIISLCYVLASSISIVGIFFAPRIIARIGAVRFTTSALSLSALLLWTISTVSSTGVLLAFILYFSLNAILVYSFDIFIEHYSQKGTTGNTRGVYLGLTNGAWVAMPFIAGLLLSNHSYVSLYSIGACIILAVLLVVRISQRHYVDKAYTTIDAVASFKQLISNPNLRRVTAVNFAVQFFFAWMVIYSPLYLSERGFTWQQLGIVFGCMLVAFPLTQYPAGRLADIYGEKKFLIKALIVAATATMLFALYGGTNLVIITAILFCTRAGIAVVEVAADSYFFKHVSESDTGVVSIYRTMAPLAYIIGPLSAAGIIAFSSYTVLYLILAGILTLTALYSYRLTY